MTNLLDWLAVTEPDVVCLQEFKATDRQFPQTAIEGSRLWRVWKGQPTWNGVAILARGAKPVLTRTELPGTPNDRQARYIEAAVKAFLSLPYMRRMATRNPDRNSTSNSPGRTRLDGGHVGGIGLHPLSHQIPNAVRLAGESSAWVPRRPTFPRRGGQPSPAPE